MVYVHARIVAAMILLIGVLYLPASADGRRRSESRPLKPAVSFTPGSGAPKALEAPILSGLDFTAVAPPGERIRVVEDEPYILLQGYNKKGLRQLNQGMTKLVLHSNSPDGGRYEAKVNLRYDSQKNDQNPLLLSFDTAAHYAYSSDLLHDESRGTTAYNLHEIRSPLGLTSPRDKENLWREYLAYDAAIMNPNSSVASGITTPYQFVSGELKVVRRVEARYYLLTINFEANEYAHALMLTENIARCIINRLEPQQDPVYRLTYAAYYPEFELAKPYHEGERINPATADLTERPGEGCGIGAAPITGDACPDCGEGGSFWSASPFGDGEFGSQLAVDEELPKCSHCLLIPEKYIEEECDECEQKVCEPQCPNWPRRSLCPPVCDGCGRSHASQSSVHDQADVTEPEAESTHAETVAETPAPTDDTEAAPVSRPWVLDPPKESNVAEAEAKSTADAVRENAQSIRDN